MFVTYSPEGSDPRTWKFSEARVKESRAEMIERRYAKLIGEKSAPFDAWRMAVLQGEASARRVMLWHLLNLDHPQLKIEDVDPLRSELTIQASREELVEQRLTVETAGGIDEATKAIMLAAIDQQIEKAPEDEDQGKAPSPTSDESTGSPSPN